MRRPFHGRERLLGRRLVKLLCSKHSRPGENRRERRAKLVGDGGQELVLDAIGVLRLFRRRFRCSDQLLALPLQALAVCNVPQNNSVELVGARPALGDLSVRRELFAVGAQRREYALAAHLTATNAGLAESLDVPAVR